MCKCIIWLVICIYVLKTVCEEIENIFYTELNFKKTQNNQNTLSSHNLDKNHSGFLFFDGGWDFLVWVCL